MIDSKIVYAKTKEGFEKEIPNIPKGLDPIVFIEDSKEAWVCGTYFSIGYPSIAVSESGGVVKVGFGESEFTMSTTGESISIRKGEGNRIIISSSALNKVNTDPPLEWDTANKKLIHMASGVTAGTYGQSANVNNASIFYIPYLNVDPTGHITGADSRTIVIRDYVEQLAPVDSTIERNILLSYEEASNSSSTAQTRKANGMTFNDGTKKLTVQGGLESRGPVNIYGYDLTVTDGYIIGKLKGDVEGEATPKIHLSSKPEYGGSSLSLYGHVRLQDVLLSKPEASSSNDNVNNTNVPAFAASPLMVWNAIQTAKDYADSLLGANNAMLFKDSIVAGTSSPGAFTPAAEVGNTYVVAFSNSSYTDNVGYILGEPVEVGDLLICKESTPAGDLTNWQQVRERWTFVQTNVTGVVSGPSKSIPGQLAIFNNTTGKLITGLANGEVGQVLTINNSGTPGWITPASQTWRPILYSNEGQQATEILSNSTSSGSITFSSTGNIKLAWNSTSRTLTFNGVSDNTWRKVLAWSLTSSGPVNIGDSMDLVFSSDFVWAEEELFIKWGVVDADGNITYTR